MSDDDLMLDVGQANEFKLALRREGATNEDVKWLCERGVLSDILKVRRGHAVITVPEHLIDCDVPPFIPDGWSVVEHRKDGMFRWDPTKVKLWLSRSQKNGGWVHGDALHEKLAKKPVLNANVLDYLLANPRLIPEEWDLVLFWGTIYRVPDGRLCVRYLYWNGDRWDWSARSLVYGWLGSYPAALRAA